jgi:membrane-associated phospholipid phosphatase
VASPSTATALVSYGVPDGKKSTTGRAMPRRLLRLFFICGAVVLLMLACPRRVTASQEQATQGEVTSQPQSQEVASRRVVEQPTLCHDPLKEVPCQIIRDQKSIWLSPFHVKGSDLQWLGWTVGATSGLIATDRRVGQGLSSSPPARGYTFSRYVGRIGGPWTDLGIAGLTCWVGRHNGDQTTQTTALLELRAVSDSWLVVEILKVATQRPRPTFGGGSVRDHNADGKFFTGGTSFPSGHAAGAFALATVVSERNREKRWVAPVAFGLASMVSISRVTVRTHFPSDVFVGATLGFLIGRYVVRSAGHPLQGRRLRSKLQPAISLEEESSLAISWEF